MNARNAPDDLPADSALFLDVDGTLLEFAPRPHEVRVPADLPPIIAACARRLSGALALVSGRAIAELDSLFVPLRLPASGLHGAETRAAPGADITRTPPLPRDVVEALMTATSPWGGVEVEDKGATLAVHYRAAPDAEAALRETLAQFATEQPVKLSLMQGEFVFELKPPGFDKGSAISGFMRLPAFAGRRPVFISDHPIDEAGFAAARALGGFGLSVGRHLPGTAGWFANPAALRAWLAAMAPREAA